MTEVGQLDEVYAQRFDDEDAERKNELWRAICGYLQRFVPRDGAVLDLACDRGDFIRNIDARERWACDVRNVAQYLPEPISFVQTDGLAIAEALPTGHFDLVFMSNYLEHLQSGDAGGRAAAGRRSRAEARRAGDGAPAEHPADRGRRTGTSSTTRSR